MSRYRVERQVHNGHKYYTVWKGEQFIKFYDLHRVLQFVLEDRG